MSSNTNTVATTPAALALIARAKAREMEAKKAEALALLDQVTALWGNMTASEIRMAVSTAIPSMTPEEAAELQTMADKAISDLDAADAANKAAKRAWRLSTPEGVESAMAEQVTQHQLEKAAKETARLAAARRAQEKAQEERIVKIINDLNENLKITDGDARAVRRFILETDWQYIPNQQGRQALLRAVRAAAAARAAALKALKGKK